MADLHCPCCGVALDLTVLFAAEADHHALSKLISASIPVGRSVMQYITLHTPERQRLTAAKKIKLIRELLPDLERQTITHKGRVWQAPVANWVSAIDQMTANRGKLALPLKGHGYLYSVLAGMADKVEAAAEAQREHDRRITPERPNVMIRGGGAVGIANALDPALQAIAEHSKQAVPPNAEIRERLAAIKRGEASTSHMGATK